MTARILRKNWCWLSFKSFKWKSLRRENLLVMDGRQISEGVIQVALLSGIGSCYKKVLCVVALFTIGNWTTWELHIDEHLHERAVFLEHWLKFSLFIYIYNTFPVLTPSKLLMACCWCDSVLKAMHSNKRNDEFVTFKNLGCLEHYFLCQCF